ncbi:MAG: cation:proton antiporter [Bryobacteraceae bacterium]|nr:cation:proton antiporter [Bryobacteraceae bacterium]
MTTLPELLAAAAPRDLNLPLAMLLIFGSAKLLGEVAIRLRLPPLVGEIVAGALVGPSVLGWIAPNPFLHSLSDLGVMFLLFTVGLEVKAAELKRVGGPAALVALGGVVLPFAAGWAILTFSGAGQTAACFAGAALVATSVGITAQVLQQGGYLHLRASRIILVAAVIDDILGLIVLAVVSGMSRGELRYWDIGLTAFFSIGLFVLAIQYGSRAMQQAVPRMRQTMRGAEADFAIAITVLFALALLAFYAGVAAIVGAFLAGVVLAGQVGNRAQDFTRGATELLVPFFLAGIGLNLDLAALRDPRTLSLATILLVAAVLTKIVGCGLGAFRYGTRDALRIGAGMVPRGEVGMVVAQLGLTLGVVSPSLYAVTVFMAVGTTVLAPPLLTWAFRGAERRMGDGESEMPSIG